MDQIKKKLKASILLNIFLTGFLIWYFGFHVGIDVYFQKYFFPKEKIFDNIYYNAKIDAFEKLNTILKMKGYTVFVGDSLIEQFPVNELSKSDNIINRGVGFDTTAGLLKRIDRNINNINIEKLFIMIGHNDFKYRSLQQTVVNIKKILEITNAEKKYFISVLPSIDTKSRDIVSLNKQIKEYCNEKGYHFIDVYHKFLNENEQINNELSYDGVHLNVKGYKIIYKEIKKINYQLKSA